MRPIAAVEEWDDIVCRLPRPHVLQSRTWGEFKSRWGWTVQRFAWGPQGRELAAAQVLVRRAGRVPLALGYLPRGPLVADQEAPAAWTTVLGDLERWARGRRLAVLKMDPDVPVSADGVREMWQQRGWTRSAEQIQFPNTMISDLAGGEAALRAAMKQKTGYNIRLAERRGVAVRFGDVGDLDRFFDLYATTARRAGFAVRSRGYYVDAWTHFLAEDLGALILAERDGLALAGVFPVAYGDTTWYLYGASAETGREHMPAYLAQWASLTWALARGCRRYDWWGGPSQPDEADPLWGVGRFKAGFGAVLVPQLGAWDFAPNPALFRAYGLLARLRHRALDLARSRH